MYIWKSIKMIYHKEHAYLIYLYFDQNSVHAKIPTQNGVSYCQIYILCCEVQVYSTDCCIIHVQGFNSSNMSADTDTFHCLCCGVSVAYLIVIIILQDRVPLLFM